jgi:hypothetical protein
MTSYGPRIPVHPDRYGAVKSQGPNRLLVVHTSEGSEGDSSAENLGVLLAQPGDRYVNGVDSKNGMYGASYHYVIDTDRVLPAVPDNVVSYSAPGANSDGIHFCIPGRAIQTREQWLDTVSRKAIRQLADTMVDRAAAAGIPLFRLTVAQIQAGRSGYCSHYDISLAYRRTNHTDPGPNFPWDVLAADIRSLLEPPPSPGDDDMTNHRRPPRIYSTRASDDVPGEKRPFAANESRRIVVPLSDGVRSVRLQVTAVPIDPDGWLRLVPGNEDASTCVHSNLNWSAGRVLGLPVEIDLDDGYFTVLASHATDVVIDWLGYVVA